MGYPLHSVNGADFTLPANGHLWPLYIPVRTDNNGEKKNMEPVTGRDSYGVAVGKYDPSTPPPQPYTIGLKGFVQSGGNPITGFFRYLRWSGELNTYSWNSFTNSWDLFQNFSISGDTENNDLDGEPWSGPVDTIDWIGPDPGLQQKNRFLTAAPSDSLITTTGDGVYIRDTSTIPTTDVQKAEDTQEFELYDDPEEVINTSDENTADIFLGEALADPGIAFIDPIYGAAGNSQEYKFIQKLVLLATIDNPGGYDPDTDGLKYVSLDRISCIRVRLVSRMNTRTALSRLRRYPLPNTDPGNPDPEYGYPVPDGDSERTITPVPPPPSTSYSEPIADDTHLDWRGTVTDVNDAGWDSFPWRTYNGIGANREVTGLIGDAGSNRMNVCYVRVGCVADGSHTVTVRARKNVMPAEYDTFVFNVSGRTSAPQLIGDQEGTTYNQIEIVSASMPIQLFYLQEKRRAGVKNFGFMDGGTQYRKRVIREMLYEEESTAGEDDDILPPLYYSRTQLDTDEYSFVEYTGSLPDNVVTLDTSTSYECNVNGAVINEDVGLSSAFDPLNPERGMSGTMIGYNMHPDPNGQITGGINLHFDVTKLTQDGVTWTIETDEPVEQMPPDIEDGISWWVHKIDVYMKPSP
jgi:hypothetical protein